MTVEYEVAHDESLRQVVAHGTVAATSELAHSVHPEIHGLEPLAGTSTDSVRDRRSPRWADPHSAEGQATTRMRFAFASRQSWSSGFYTAYEHMSDEDLDLVVHLSDCIYERGWRRGREGMSMEVGRDEAVDLPSSGMPTRSG